MFQNIDWMKVVEAFVRYILPLLLGAGGGAAAALCC